MTHEEPQRLALSEAQRTLLADLRQREVTGIAPEWFAPNMAVVHALVGRGLITTRFIGQRWWTIQLTKAGRQWSRS